MPGLNRKSTYQPIQHYYKMKEYEGGSILLRRIVRMPAAKWGIAGAGTLHFNALRVKSRRGSGYFCIRTHETPAQYGAHTNTIIHTHAIHIDCVRRLEAPADPPSSHHCRCARQAKRTCLVVIGCRWLICKWPRKIPQGKQVKTLAPGFRI